MRAVARRAELLDQLLGDLGGEYASAMKALDRARATVAEGLEKRRDREVDAACRDDEHYQQAKALVRQIVDSRRRVTTAIAGIPALQQRADGNLLQLTEMIAR